MKKTLKRIRTSKINKGKKAFRIRNAECDRRLGVHLLRKWANEGKIGCARTVEGRRRFPESEINRLLGQPQVADIKGQPKAGVYVRLSTKKQKASGNLERQQTRVVNYCIEKGYAVIGVYSDIDSGLNPNRRGLMKLFAVKKEKVKRLLSKLQNWRNIYSWSFWNTFNQLLRKVGVCPWLLRDINLLKNLQIFSALGSYGSNNA